MGEEQQSDDERLGLSPNPWGGTGYVNVEADRSCVDGWFTAEDLRKIANDMDRLKRERESE